MTTRRPLLRDMALLLRAWQAVARVRLDLSLHRHDALRARIARIAASRPQTSAGQNADLAEVAWSVAAAARLVPGATCLTQATAGQMMLARRGRSSIVRLSLPAGAVAGFRPHAWLIAGDRILLGGTGADHAAHSALCDFAPEGRIAAAPVIP